MVDVLFVPGFRHNAQDLEADYAPVTAILTAKGYRTRFVPINWRGTTINGWVNQTQRTYDTCDPRETILAGFSYGAITAAVVAADRPPRELWAWSMSAYFAEDIPGLPKAHIDGAGPRRMKAFAKLHFADLAPRITCPTLLILGEKEYVELPTLAKRVTLAHQMINSSRLVIAQDASHNPTDSGYLQAISTI
jgi:pimeloyl-ACP methyl ester carboxylesterase